MSMQEKPTLSLLPILIITLGGFAFAAMDTTAKYLAVSGVPVLLIIWARYSLQTGITFLALLAKTRSLRFLKADRPGLQLLRAASLFCATLMFYNGLKYISLGDATAIIFLIPVIVTAISALFLKETVSWRRWLGVAVAFLGVMVVVRPGSGVFGYYAFLPLGAAVMTAIYFTMTRVLSTIDSPSATAFYTTAVGAIGLSLAVKLFWVPQDTTTWGIMILAGFLGALGHGLIVLAYKAAEASALAPFTYSQILAAIFWGFIVFGDIPSVWTIAGASLIIGGGLFVWYSERHIDAPQPHDPQHP